MFSTTDLRTEQDTLLDLARRSIRHGLTHGAPIAVDLSRCSALTRQLGATFVTLHLAGALRGCIGTLEAHQPLIQDIADNAFNAAFRDPRFPPVTDAEIDRLDIHISVLTPPQPMNVTSEDELLAQLRPGTDGVILEEGTRRGTFLPAVWEQLPTPREFVRQLKRKAGLPENYWSPTLRVARYEAISLPPSDASA